MTVELPADLLRERWKATQELVGGPSTVRSFALAKP